jgi:hypothetical protein
MVFKQAEKTNNCEAASKYSVSEANTTETNLKNVNFT